MKIVADTDIPFLKGILEPFAEVVYLRGDEIRACDVRNADAVLTRTRTRWDASTLDGSRVRFIGTATIGFDHIDTDYCASHGIAVRTAAGCNARAVLQWVAAALGWLAGRGLKPSDTTIGVVGVGNVGSLVREYVRAWGFRVMCSDPPRERAERLLGTAEGSGSAQGLGTTEGLDRAQVFYPLSELASECDIITFHVPLVSVGRDATRGLVGREFLAALKPEAVILNSSRGAIVDPEALREAVGSATASLAKGATRFVIDTWNGEPDIDREVLERVLLGTPHIAGYSVQGKAMATAMVVRALARDFGLPLHDWYPEGVARSVPRAISWDEMCRTMPSYFDIATESAALKAAPERFELMRDTYNYRTEYF